RGVDVLHALLVPRQVGDCGPEIFAGARDIEARDVRLASVGEQSTHDVPAGQPVGLLRRAKEDAGARELVGYAPAAAAAPGENRIVSHALRADSPALA